MAGKGKPSGKGSSAKTRKSADWKQGFAVGMSMANGPVKKSSSKKKK
jgi:hypothetical protein